MRNGPIWVCNIFATSWAQMEGAMAEAEKTIKEEHSRQVHVS